MFSSILSLKNLGIWGVYDNLGGFINVFTSMISSPFHLSEPLSGTSNPATLLRSVDLPDPILPAMTVNDSFFIVNDISSIPFVLFG